MATELKRMTFVVTSEIEEIMDRAKRIFYDKTQSEMIRTLVVAGLKSIEIDTEQDQLQTA